MKLVIMLFLMVVLLTASTDKKPQEFKVAFEVTYNSITLAKAAELEKVFRDKFSDACNVEVKVEKINSNVWTYSGTLQYDTLRTKNYFQLNNGAK